jgi:hypothetical protein
MIGVFKQSLLFIVLFDGKLESFKNLESPNKIYDFFLYNCYFPFHHLSKV